MESLEPTNTLCGWIRTRRDSAGWGAWTVERRAHSREEVAYWKASLGEQARGWTGDLELKKIEEVYSL
jgi:hypothetical protein